MMYAIGNNNDRLLSAHSTLSDRLLLHFNCDDNVDILVAAASLSFSHSLSNHSEIGTYTHITARHGRNDDAREVADEGSTCGKVHAVGHTR